MGSTFHSLHYHIVFSTFERMALIKPAWSAEFHQYLGGTVRGLGGVAETVGGVADHVHLLTSLTTTHDIASFVRELKKSGTDWARQHHVPQFRWQEGYAAFSVSWTHCPAVRRYIETQEAHHAGGTEFVDELRRLLKRNGVKWEEKYLL